MLEAVQTFRPAARTPEAVHSAADMQRALERERARADRSGGCLSVIAFDASACGVQRQRELIRVLAERLRATDEIGRLRDGRIAALLPDTSADGAEHLARKLTWLANECGCVVQSEVYAYQADSGVTGSQVAASADTSPTRPAEQQVFPLEELLVHPLPLWKRAIDIVGALVALTLAAPVILAAAVMIKLTAPGPVFFVQRRSGLGGRPFWIYKLRTMRVGADAEKAALRAQSEQDGPAFKLTRDPRVTKIGSFLRKTSIDELPQLWNVLRGDMSLVGPRPLPCDESDACSSWQRRRLDVTPGLTCIWQIRGRSRVRFVEWMRMDAEYIRNRSLLTDLKLILATIPAVLLRRGAH